MKLVFATFVVFGLSMLGMAVGLRFGRARIRGSCAGIAGLCEGGRSLCEFCPNRGHGGRDSPTEPDG